MDTLRMIVIICHCFLSNYDHLIFFNLLHKLTLAILYRVVGACDDLELSFVGADE